MLTSVVVSAPHLRTRLEHMREAIDKGWAKEAVTVGWRVVELLRETTPRSEGKGSQDGEHIADGWTLHVIGGTPRAGRGILLVIYNRFITSPAGKILARARLKRFNEFSGKDERGDYTLLHILEYGSRPHRIFPFKKKALKFISAQGNVVFTKMVNHPGTKPVGMIRNARVQAVRWFKDFLEKWKPSE